MKTRSEKLTNLLSEHFDLLIIGGGITGAGIALDAALRGLKTADKNLLDKRIKEVLSFRM